MEKDLITTNLLGIRAGLSMISKNTDEIRKHNEMINASHETLENISANINFLEKEIHDLNRQKENLVSEISNNPDEIEAKKALEESKIRGFSKPYIRFEDCDHLLFSFSVIIAVVSGFILYVNGIMYDKPIILPLTFFLISIISLPILYIYYGFRDYKIIKTNTYNRLHEKYLESKEKSNIQISYIDKQIQYRKSKINDLLTLKDSEIKNQPFLAQCQNEINTLSTQSKLIFKALNDTYGVFLSESDWGNIDLLIHYFETGRADDMKEALQLVDRQRQTDQIVHAIRAAQEAICSHIESAFARMGEALAECFTRLDQRLEVISSQLEANRISNSSENEALLKKLNEQVSATEISHALLEKSNTTNQQLLNDLRYNQRFWVK